MKVSKCIVGGLIVTTATVMTAMAQTTNVTFRTPAAFEGVIQSEDAEGKPVYEFQSFIGADLVNLALGTAIGTVRTNEVLAMEVACDSSSAELVVFDRATSSNLATIATSSKITVVQQQDNPLTAFPDRERFAMEMNVTAGGSGSDALLSGYIDMAGRLYLNPTNGCPRAVLVDTDTLQDKIAGDPTAVTDTIDTKLAKGVARFAGRGHFHGALSAIIDGQTNTMVVPYGALSIDRRLATSP